jgi:hypothetical protein
MQRPFTGGGNPNSAANFEQGLRPQTGGGGGFQDPLDRELSKPH